MTKDTSSQITTEQHAKCGRGGEGNVAEGKYDNCVPAEKPPLGRSELRTNTAL